jgi:hypothetical protein
MTGANGADIIKRRIFSPESAHKTDVPHSRRRARSDLIAVREFDGLERYAAHGVNLQR